MSDSDSMNTAFLSKLTEVVRSNLQNEQFGVSELAREMRMSRSHIHRQLKVLSNKSVSQFIREVRLEKAKKLLEDDTLTGSEIAYKVGFSSPSYFIKSFHDYFGYPPGEVKKKFILQDEKANEWLEKAGIKSETSQRDLKKPEISRTKFKRKKIILPLAAVLILILAAWLLHHFLEPGNVSPEIFNRKNKELSIIVLPFKNLSDDVNNQYFADGIMEDILNNLFRITALRVVSRTSAEQFRESTLSVKEIASKMNVNYVLEGSVRHYDDKTRISVQLIDADCDQHLWSSNFDLELTDIIGVQGEIALQVANKLDAVLSSNEISQIEKISTQNPEAYDFYLRARFILNKANSPQRSGFDEDGVKNCIRYYEKAIEADSSFAEAYAGLASAWLKLSAWGILGSNEGFLKGREFSIKALEIDPNCAESHSVLGTFLIWGQRKFEEGGKELQTSIRLNPNFATSRQAYAQFLMITGPIEEAREQVNHALRLEPYFWVVQNLNSWIYYFEEKYKEALETCKIAYDHNPNFSSNHWLFVLNYYKLGEGEKMKQQLQTVAKNYSKSDVHTKAIQQAYEKEGIEGLLIWMIKTNKNNPIKVEGLNGHPFFIAWWNVMLGNKEEAVYWLEKTMQEKSIPYHYFNLIATNPDFDILRDDPRFLKVIDDIGLTPYHNRKAK